MQKVSSVICIIVGLILSAICLFAIIKAYTTPLIIIGFVAGLFVVILGVLFIIRINNKKIDSEDTIEE